MRRTAILLAPLAVFLLAAVAGWLAGADAVKSERTDSPRRTRLAIRAERVEAEQGLAGLEREFLVDAEKPATVRDAAGMEEVLKAGGDFPWTGGGEYVRRWAEEDPAGMLDWLMHRGPLPGGASFGRPFFAHRLFSQWAKDDLKSALPAALALQNPDLRGQALISCLEVLARTDPERARDLLAKNIGLYAASGPTPIFYPWDGLKSNCDLLLSLPPGLGRTRLLNKLFEIESGKGETRPVWAAMPEALRQDMVAAGFSGDSRFAGLGELLRERAETRGDRTAALNFLRNEGAEWAQRDLPAAFDWTQINLKGWARVERGAALFEDAAKVNFDNAVTHWRALPDGVLKDGEAKAIADGAPAERKPEAEALVKSLTAPDGR